MRELATLQAPAIAYIWIGILTFTTYVFAGHMREQVCVYMCPWPRIQAAMTDENALNVTYRVDRGEPRMSFKKATQLRTQGQPAGDCVDCDQCVAVCPTGVDIREGPSLGCIQCGLCIDACDTVMAKVGRPARLIAYDTDVNILRREHGQKAIFRPFRARTMLYVGIIAIVGGVMLFTLLTRSNMNIAAIHDRNPLFVMLSDGSVRNSFTVRVSNKAAVERRFVLTTSGVDGLRLNAVGIEAADAASPMIVVGPDQTREVRVHGTLGAGSSAVNDLHGTDVVFTITDASSGEKAMAKDHFFAHEGQ